MATVTNSLNCLLCSNNRLQNTVQLNGLQVCALWRELGKEFPPEALERIDDKTEVILWRCTDCGFEFFDPALAGNSLFYKCLDSSEYYSSSRPEFQRTVKFAVKMGLSKVLDVGCGAGDFLDLARTAGLQTFGMELNPAAVAKSRAKGHRIFDQLLHEMPADACPDGLDLITLFQVLEHVPDPIGVLRQASARLKTGGFISIAVPSKSGIYRLLPWDPAQWPPHHISRWRLADFKTLAQQTNLQLIHAGGDVLLGSRIEQVLHSRSRLERALGRKTQPPADIWPKVLSWFYRKFGMKYVFPHWGNSIYAYFRKV